MIRFLKDRMSSISSDLYEEILKLITNRHTNRIIEIVPCKTALTFAECLIIKVIKSSLPNAPFALLPLKIKRLLIFSGGIKKKYLKEKGLECTRFEKILEPLEALLSI